MANNGGFHIHYWLFYYSLRIIYRLFFRWEIRGLENFPKTGGFILAVNHASYFDPTIAGSAAPRKVHYLARRTLFKTRFLDAFLRSVYAIPIDRGGIDIAAIKQVIEIVSRGEVILIFPEGTRTLDGNLQPVRQGIGFVMKRAHADVLPCYIDGSWEILPRGRKMVRFHKLKVVFGEMIRYRQFAELPSDKEHYQKISNFVMEKIGELKAKIERE